MVKHSFLSLPGYVLYQDTSRLAPRLSQYVALRLIRVVDGVVLPKRHISNSAHSISSTHLRSVDNVLSYHSCERLQPEPDALAVYFHSGLACGNALGYHLVPTFFAIEVNHRLSCTCPSVQIGQRRCTSLSDIFHPFFRLFKSKPFCVCPHPIRRVSEHLSHGPVRSVRV